MLKTSLPAKINRTNIQVFFVTAFVNLSLLFACARIESWPIKILLAVVFSFTNNTMFSLLHEAVHGAFHSVATTNRFYGILASAFFPTVYDFQKRVHLAHHKNNRTHLEQFDFLRTNDIKWLKYSQWYAILTGIYWAFPPMGAILLAISPKIVVAPMWTKQGHFSEQVGSVSMITPLQKGDLNHIRYQAWWTIVFQAGVLWMMNWNWSAWLVCYYFFGFNWSSLQYADHAWSKLDPAEGAWNLKVPNWVHFFFLDYHFHKVHHEHPNLSWLDLRNNVRPEDPNPSFWGIYKEMWKGPKKFDPEYVYVEKKSSH